MQLEFDKQQQKLKIKDEVPTHSWLVIFLMLVNVFNMAIQLFFMSYAKNELLFIVMLFLGLISVAVVLFYVLQRSWKSNYKLADVKGIEVRKVLGRERIFLKLLNGRKRSFSILKDEKELENLKRTLISMGIKPV
ncbi:hypothetical protein [Tenacibaculum caenipelagi]|uniref:PH (Pleckstrin Homology) domain-containing protein n=1 Tax=Tenacibaculum caenipelagi TaxID=1325435 RepID=A0A4R6TF47_9FLAO|nr:hypothetical protein [Tenacibaculum caenipelagi]TDQ28578.1 hypothetical protein DFQ07_0954 [Tenacibaculum caenipelagi]